MKLSNKLMLVFAILAAFSLTATCGESSSKPEGVSGLYSVEGTNPDGSEYEGTVTITRSGETYTFNWSIMGDQYSGTGTLEGDTLTVDWGQQYPAIYQVKDGGDLLGGTWNNGEGTETLTR